jgi:hypothetical protein
MRRVARIRSQPTGTTRSRRHGGVPFHGQPTQRWLAERARRQVLKDGDSTAEHDPHAADLRVANAVLRELHDVQVIGAWILTALDWAQPHRRWLSTVRFEHPDTRRRYMTTAARSTR